MTNTQITIIQSLLPRLTTEDLEQLREAIAALLEKRSSTVVIFPLAVRYDK